MSEIVVIGSLNMDLSVGVPRLPARGETIIGSGLVTSPGGKGANQAAACALLGRKVSMVGRVGKDDLGAQVTRSLLSMGVDIHHVVQDTENPSGTAMILVDPQGDNMIVVSPGSNGQVSKADLQAVRSLIEQAKIVLLQFEIPLETVQEAVHIAHRAGVPVLLNPAPAAKLSDAIYNQIDFLVPNETEAAQLTGVQVTDIASAGQAARALLAKGTKTVIITLGEKGALLASQDMVEHVPAVPVNAVDATAAGDAFVAGFASAYVSGYSLIESVKFACCAGALTATRHGAQSSLPNFAEVMAVYKPEGGR